MTVLISLPHPKMIVMAADSMKTTYVTHRNFDFNPVGHSIEYASTNKIFPVPGVGCISFWGELTRASLSFPVFLAEMQADVNNVEDLRAIVEEFLRTVLKAELIRIASGSCAV